LSIRKTRTSGNTPVDQDISLENVCFGGNKATNKATGDSTKGGAAYFEAYKTVKRVNVLRAAENSADTCDDLFLGDVTGADSCFKLAENGVCIPQTILPTR
jgi:hypothetical protein